MQPFGQPASQSSAPAPAGHSYDVSKMDPALLQKFVEAACQGQFGPQAKQMAESAKGQSAGGDNQPQQTPDPQQPPQPGRTLASKHIFGRKPVYQPGQDDDQDDQQGGQPMGAANIFGR
jgi:hypothetical protein